jgi:Cu2+-exporting ATPase
MPSLKSNVTLPKMRRRSAPSLAKSTARKNGNTAPGHGALRVSFPSSNRIHVHSDHLFADPHGDFSRQFAERAFLAHEVESVEIEGQQNRAEISFRRNGTTGEELIKKISSFFIKAPADKSSRKSKSAIHREAGKDSVRFNRQAPAAPSASAWKVKHETSGRIRFHNPALHRRRELCQEIERELMSVPGVDRYSTNDLTDTVLIHY